MPDSTLAMMGISGASRISNVQGADIRGTSFVVKTAYAHVSGTTDVTTPCAAVARPTRDGEGWLRGGGRRRHHRHPQRAVHLWRLPHPRGRDRVGGGGREVVSAAVFAKRLWKFPATPRAFELRGVAVSWGQKRRRHDAETSRHAG